jgi:DNA-binding NarL/FixJ family response regulator
VLFLPIRTYALARAFWNPLTSRTPITIALAHFDDLLAGGLRELIENDSTLTILAADVEHTRIPVVLSAHRPDVAILDASALANLAEIRELNAQHPNTRLVLLAENPSEAECVQLLAFGASACLGRDTQSRDILHAIHLASRGLQVTPRPRSSASGRSFTVGHQLTRRESEVLPLLAQNRSNAQIAIDLQIGLETVRTHARNIYRKLGVSSRRELGATPVPDAERRPPSTAPSRRPRTTVRMRRGHGLRR